MPADPPKPMSEQELKDRQAAVHREREADCKAGRRHYYVQGRCWYCNRPEVESMEPAPRVASVSRDPESLLTFQLSDGTAWSVRPPPVVSAAIHTLCCEQAQQRDQEVIKQISEDAPVLERILDQLVGLTNIVRGIRDK